MVCLFKSYVFLKKQVNLNEHFHLCTCIVTLLLVKKITSVDYYTGLKSFYVN